jgi:hypothetical protein
LAVSTVVRKQRPVVGSAGEDATLGDERPTSAMVRRAKSDMCYYDDIPLIVTPSGSRMSPLHMSAMVKLVSFGGVIACAW